MSNQLIREGLTVLKEVFNRPYPMDGPTWVGPSEVGYTSQTDDGRLIKIFIRKMKVGKVFKVEDIKFNKELASSYGWKDTDRIGDVIFIVGDKTVKVELKIGRDLFYKGGYSSKLGRNTSIYETKKFKAKSFLSEKRTVEDFKKEKTFDYMMVLDVTARRLVVVEDEVARSLYQEGSDGAMMELKLGDYYECDLGEYEVTQPPESLSELINNATDRFLDF